MNRFEKAARLHGWRISSDGSCIHHEQHGAFSDEIGTVSPGADDAWKMLCTAHHIPVPAPLRVVVEVSGGVAEVTTCPEGADVEIIDHDNLKEQFPELDF